MQKEIHELKQSLQELSMKQSTSPVGFTPIKMLSSGQNPQEYKSVLQKNVTATPQQAWPPLQRSSLQQQQQHVLDNTPDRVQFGPSISSQPSSGKASQRVSQEDTNHSNGLINHFDSNGQTQDTPNRLEPNPQEADAPHPQQQAPSGKIPFKGK